MATEGIGWSVDAETSTPGVWQVVFTGKASGDTAKTWARAWARAGHATHFRIFDPLERLWQEGHLTTTGKLRWKWGSRRTRGDLPGFYRHPLED